MTFLPAAVHYTNDQFKSVVDELHFSLWQPKYIVLHNTAAPSLAQLAQGGITEQQRIDNIVTHFRSLHWHSGAHLIVSPNYIWVACELTQDGVHCSCANRASIGIEMIGDYSREAFDSGQGAAVRDKAVFAMAVLHLKLGLTPVPIVLWKKGLHFHKQCTADHHNCPGENVVKADIVARIQAEMSALSPQAPRRSTRKTKARAKKQ